MGFVPQGYWSVGTRDYPASGSDNTVRVLFTNDQFQEEFGRQLDEDVFVGVMNGKIETLGNYPVSTRYVAAQHRVDAILNNGTNSTVRIRYIVAWGHMG